jgi:hypothetical protein
MPITLPTESAHTLGDASADGRLRLVSCHCATVHAADPT